MDLTPAGVWSFTEGLSAAQAAEYAQRVEALGYGALWIPEALGRHSFAHAAWLLANSERLVVATGIANIYARDAVTTAQAARTLAEQSGGRFVLGLGVSHAPMVTGLRGHDYGKPVATMRAYLDALESAPYAAVRPEHEPPVVLAALGPRMLRLAGERTRGAHPYLGTPEHTARARELLGEGPWLCPEQKLLLVRDASTARAVARGALAMYLALENYRNSWKRLGFDDSDFSDGGSDRLVDALVAWGDEQTLADRVRAHRDAGASHVCIQPLHPEGKPLPDLRVLEALAPA